MRLTTHEDGRGALSRHIRSLSTRESRRARRWWPVVAIFLISLPAVTTRIYASDEIQYFAFLRSLWFDGDLSFENEYQYFYTRGIAVDHGFHHTYLELTTATGLRVNFGTIGSAVLWSPFYAAADALVRIANWRGASVPADGFSWPYIAAVCYGSAFYGFMAVILSALVARRLIGHGTRAALIVWIGTPLLFYMYVAPVMAHATSAFAVALFVWVWLRVRGTWSIGGCCQLAASAALMIMVREQDAFYVVGPAADYLWSNLAPLVRRERPPSAYRIAAQLSAALAVFSLAYLPQIVAYLVLNGRPGPSPLVSRKMSWSSPHALDVLFSPGHGLFLWSPLALLAVAGFFLLLRSARVAPPGDGVDWRVRGGILMMFLSAVYIAGSVESWSAAGAFGQRRFVGATVLLAIGLAVVFERAKGAVPKAGLAVAVAAAVWWNLALMAQFGAGLMDRQRLELQRNAYTAFVILPRIAPELAWRYLFDRSSFYRRTQPSESNPR